VFVSILIVRQSSEELCQFCCYMNKLRKVYLIVVFHNFSIFDKINAALVKKQNKTKT